MSGCCSERGCTRSQPFLILPSSLGDGWYLVTRYRRNDFTGGVLAYEKHDITEQVEALLQREREAKPSGCEDILRRALEAIRDDPHNDTITSVQARDALAEAAACPPKPSADAVIDAVLAEWEHRECGGMVEFDDAYLPAIRAGKSKTIADRLGAKALLDAFAAEVKQRLAT